MNHTAKFFKTADTALMRISPMHDVMLLRVVVASIAVIAFLIEMFTQQTVVYWIGLIFYIFCLLLYAIGLAKVLLMMHKVSAELLIVTVMAVTLIDGEPLSGALVAWFIGLGLYISFTIIRKNREKIESLVKDGKRTARVIEEDGSIRDVPIDQVSAGNIVIVPKGDMIPVDGVILEGTATLDESFVTGEPYPVVRQVGEEVTSGTVNISDPIQLRAVHDGNNSFISLITNEIEDSLQKKPELQKQADSIVQILLIGVTGYSFLLYAVTGSLTMMATALAIVCPCAWALATPTAFASAIGRLASKHILVRNGESLETLNKAGTMVFDKTGTVTKAEPVVKEVIPHDFPEKELLEITASVEARFNHPIARSITGYAKEQGISPNRDAAQTEDIPGCGVRSVVDGNEVIIGSSETMENTGIELPDIKYEGRAIWVQIGGELKGAIIIQDLVNEEMTGLADQIRATGIERVILATGDNEEREAERVSNIIGADEYRFNCKPADKTALVTDLREHGNVVMVGDGVNDAPALAAAHTGIAIGGHKNVNLAIKSSDIIILGDDAGNILSILRTAKKMGGVIRQNYIWAISFNVVGLALATAGVLNPVLAAVLHHVSSVFVVSNAARIYFGKD